MNDNNHITYPPNLGLHYNYIIDNLHATNRNLISLKQKISQHFDIVEEINNEKILIAKIPQLKILGWTIPETITEMKCAYTQYIVAAVGLERMKIDWHTELMDKLIQHYSA